MSSTLESQMKPVGDALITYFQPVATSLGLASWDWAKQMTSQPSMPCNPRTQCPRGFLRFYRADHSYGATIGCDAAKFVYACSIWIQLRQTPGQDHQEIMVAALDEFSTKILQSDFELSNELGIDTLRSLNVLPNQSVTYDELKHPLGDPTLTVSVGEFNMTLEGELRGV